MEVITVSLIKTLRGPFISSSAKETFLVSTNKEEQLQQQLRSVMQENFLVSVPFSWCYAVLPEWVWVRRPVVAIFPQTGEKTVCKTIDQRCSRWGFPRLQNWDPFVISFIYLPRS